MSKQPIKPQLSSYIVVKPPPEKFTPEWALFKFLDGFTAEDMELAVKKNYPWDLSGYLEKIVDYAVEELLKWLAEYKPQHYKVLNNPEGRRYLKCQMKQALIPT